MIKQVRANYDAPTIEKEIQAAWKSEDAYLKTKALRENGKKFYFVDGPPYTTGHIHMGTAFNKTIKDILLRYWRMNGLNVRDQPGYDMHGLPIEVQIEKMIKVPGRVNKDGKPDEVGVRSKKEIEEVIGIDNFVNTCREHALTLRASMTEEFKELGVWMDWEHPYQTLNKEYVESAWWTIQRAYDRNLLDSSSRVVTWCPRCETALAEAEIEYWDETDPSVMIRMPLVDDPETSLLIWTTTPWTLPSNMAIAAHPEFDYAKIKLIGENGEDKVICLESQAEYVTKKGGFEKFEVIERYKGKDMVGMAYIPPFDIDDKFMKKSEYVYKVVNADYVENDNTGLVHTAPGFGPDDYDTGKRYGMEPFCPVGEAGRYTEAFPMMEGKKVKTANDEIIKYLKEKGVLFNTEKIKHRYGHCWRCKTPIIYRNTRQWFITVPKVKSDMLAEIDRVKWVPDWAGSTREKNWVEGARDWCVSRQRYWGIPIPVWECECGERKAVGQIEQLKGADGYTEGMDIHRPWIDKVTFTCPKCGKTMHRVPDILDVWFDSGVAAWASLGYPAKKEEYDTWWPPKFIVEAHDQTRGWFYSQLGAGVISFDKAPYDEVMMHAWMLDPKGQKMSKSLGNVVEPKDVIKEFGADAMRLYSVRANAPWEDTCFQWDMKKNPPLKEGPKNAWKVLNTYWNVVKFASMYMEIDGFDPAQYDLADVDKYLRNEDRWMFSKTEKMKAAVTAALESRELHKGARALENYIMEDLSKWYVKLIRDRSWTEDEESKNDKIASYCTLYYAIMQTAIAMAPYVPHISEEVYRHMGGTLLTVHMEDWPKCNEDLIKEDIEHNMSIIQELVETIATERAKMGSKLRWPLKQIYVCGKDAESNKAVEMFEDVLKQQGNIKDIVYIQSDKMPRDKEPCDYSEGQIVIDFDVTPEIEAEGYARELIRRIQQMRKDMKLNVEQYIDIDVGAEEYLNKLFSTWKDFIAGEVRAKNLTFSEPTEGDGFKVWDITGKNVSIKVVPL